jgi:adenosylmethionine-8-amino-7-oxononanoate aminotransferase
MARGVITLVTGLPHGNILAICPPFVITDEQCEYILSALASSIEAIDHRKA